MSMQCMCKVNSEVMANFDSQISSSQLDITKNCKSKVPKNGMWMIPFKKI